MSKRKDVVEGAQLVREFERQTWHDLLPKLYAFAAYQMQRRYRIYSERGTRGRQAVDFVHKALEHILLEERRWNRKVYPALVDFVKSTMNSMLYNHFVNHCNRETNVDQPVLESAAATRPAISDNELLQSLQHQLRRSNCTAVDLEVFNCIAEGIEKPSEIAAQLKLNVTDVNNAKKRLARRLARIMKKLDL